MRTPLTRVGGLNQQQAHGKPQKHGKVYPNAYFTGLCHMSEEEVRKDLKYFEDRGIRNYFTTDFKKQFKVHRHEEKLCFLRSGIYTPLAPGKYGFIVSPKGGLYAIFHPRGVPKPDEIQNPQFFHSLFRAGQPVQSAGFLFYDSATGQVTDIFRDSGHYKPTFTQHLRTCKGLVRAGILTPETRIGKYSDTRDPLTYPLSAIETEQVDYSAIAGDDTAAPPPPPPPMQGFRARASVAASSQPSLGQPVSTLHDGYGQHDPHAPLHFDPQAGRLAVPDDRRLRPSPASQRFFPPRADHVAIDMPAPDYVVIDMPEPEPDPVDIDMAGEPAGARGTQSALREELRALRPSKEEKPDEEDRADIGSLP